MRQDRPRSGSQAEGDFSPVGKLRYRRGGHGEINRVTKVRNSHGGPELDRQARYDRRGACQDATIFEIVVGPNLPEAKSFQGRPRVLGEADQFRERVTVEDVKRIVDTDFTSTHFYSDRHTGAAITAS